jgi:hypothetical protein
MNKHHRPWQPLKTHGLCRGFSKVSLAGIVAVLAAGSRLAASAQTPPGAPGAIHSAPAAKAPDRPDARIEMAPLGPAMGVGPSQWSAILPPFTAEKLDELQREDAAPGSLRPRVGVVRALGEPLVVNRRTVPASEWTTLPNGWRVWSAGIAAQGALGVRLHLESVVLPGGARLLAYNPEQPERARTPIAAGDLSENRDVWTGSVFAESVVLECEAPPGADLAAVAFTANELSHQYRLAAAGPQPRAQTCENDATCSPAWANQEDAIARIQFIDTGNEYLCSGCLLNHNDTNIVADYFLTANHCIENQTVASTLQLFWLYQTTVCNDPNSAPDFYTMPFTSGGTLLATSSADTGNDFSFLRLPQAPPSGVYYAGWTTQLPTNNEQVTGIHHPGQPPPGPGETPTDYSRISFGNEIGEATLPGSTLPNGSWEVQWYSGITEDGSSGSPLFDANQLVIGQLYGGQSACDDQSGPDVYGRFDITYKAVRGWLDPVSAGTYNGLFYDTNDIAAESAGYIRVKVAFNGRYTGTLRLGQQLFPLSGRFNSQDLATNTLFRSGNSPLTVTMSLASSTNQLTGTVSDGFRQSQLFAVLSPFNANTNPAPEQGQYTMAILGSTNAGVAPAGDGFGAVTVGPGGLVTLKGSLADGAPVSQTALLTQTGQWPLFVPLYGGQGLILGWMSFDTNQPPAALHGVLNWIRPAIPSAILFPAGFTNGDAMAMGSKYTRVNPLITLANGAFVFSGGTLSSPATNSVTLAANNQFVHASGEHLSVVVALPSGLFSGSVVLPGTMQHVPFRGAMLQDFNAGYGYFLSPAQNGGVTLESQ